MAEWDLFQNKISDRQLLQPREYLADINLRYTTLRLVKMARFGGRDSPSPPHTLHTTGDGPPQDGKEIPG